MISVDNIENGDIIKYTCQNIPLCIHFGIVYKDGFDTYILHNTPDTGATMTGFEEMLNGREYEGHEKSHISGISSNKLMQKFEACKSKEYSNATNNCEDFMKSMGTRGFVLQQNHFAFIVGGLELLYLGKYLYKKYK